MPAKAHHWKLLSGGQAFLQKIANAVPLMYTSALRPLYLRATAMLVSTPLNKHSPRPGPEQSAALSPAEVSKGLLLT
jgi:hypothetical protein